jgi:multidrug transporter EmrE-like cation transporter
MKPEIFSSKRYFYMGYTYIFGTILFTVYGQLIIKWQMAKTNPLPHIFGEKIIFLLQMFLNPWILSAFLSAFLASLCWMAAITKFELSHAYPFMSLSFVFVLVLSGFLFQESITLPKLFGVLLIITGVIVGAQG